MSSLSRQHGVASLTVIAALAMSIVFVALAVDVGRLSWEAKKLQNVADLAAMDAMTEAGLCSGVQSLDEAALESAAQASAVRNGYTGDLAAEGGIAAGTLATVNGRRNFVPGDISAANAVEVTASKTVTSSLVAGGWVGGTTTLRRRAVAYDNVLGAISEGSFLVAVDSDDSVVLNAVLGGLLGAGVNLDAASYQGLADAQVTLESLATASGPGGIGVSAGTVDSFLQANVTAGQFLQIIATALGNGHTAYADVDGLASAATNVNAIVVSDLIEVTTDNPGSAADAMLNVFDLVSGSVQLANENNTVNLPMNLNLPLGLGSVTAVLHITEGPRYAIGPPGVDAAGNWKTQVHTSPVRLEINVDLAGGAPILSGLVSVSGQLSLYADVAAASAWLETIECASVATLAHVANIGVQTGVTGVGIGRFDDISDPASAIDPSPALQIEVAGGLVSLNADVSADVQAVASHSQVIGIVTNSAHPLPQSGTVSTPLGDALNNVTNSVADTLVVESSISGGSALLLEGVGLSVPAIEAGMTNDLLAPLLASLDELLLDPLFRALGIQLGGADVTLHDIQRSDPRLAG